MKYIHFTLFICLLCGFGKSAGAQNTPSLTVSDHPSVNSLSVHYSIAASHTVHLVYPTIAIRLKPGSSVSGVALTILSKQDSTVLYQVSYALSSAPVTDSTGKKRFYIKNLEPVISVPLAVPLDTYIYKVRTLDAQGQQSTEYISRQ